MFIYLRQGRKIFRPQVLILGDLLQQLKNDPGMQLEVETVQHYCRNHTELFNSISKTIVS